MVDQNVGAPTKAGPQRSYARVATHEMPGGFGVLLDSHILGTPAGAAFSAPTLALARACAEEWRAQGERIAPLTMPLTQLAFAAIDRTSLQRAQCATYVASFAQTDLCCHRAEGPAELITRQRRAWDPLVAWGEQALGVVLPVVAGVTAADVSPQAIAALRARSAVLNDFRLTALSQGAGLTGSALIGFALLAGRLDADAAFQAAALENLWSLERWGDDSEARAQLDTLLAQLHALCRFVVALETP